MKERERSGIPESLIHESITPWISAKTVEPAGGEKQRKTDTCLNIIMMGPTNVVKCS